MVGGGKWGVPGGKLERSDLPEQVNRNAVETLLARETLEECGLTIEPTLTYLRSLTFVRPDGIPVITLSFAARYHSGEVALEAGSITDFAWVSETEVESYDCLGQIKEEIKQAITLLHAA
jgi:8-oxo-dGTP pyrophosphatase MutT (NUDIX family)